MAVEHPAHPQSDGDFYQKHFLEYRAKIKMNSTNTLDHYTSLFQNLRVDKNRNHYPEATTHRAPHKPFLLLSIIDLVAQGHITSNLIEPSFDLTETFATYWSAVMPITRRGLMSYPFYHMRNEPFWRLIPRPGHQDRPGQTFSSMTRIRKIYAGAEIDEPLYALLQDLSTREIMRTVLVKSYFAPAVQPLVYSQGKINYASGIYAQHLTTEIFDGLESFGESKEEDEKKIRDQGFRRAIVALYDHRCALCGIRMLTPEGHTVVEAAHIIGWSKSRDDRPTNGLCLCRLCHWSFDEGLMSVGRSYEVIVSKRVRMESNNPGHILTLSDRPIFVPKEDRFRPAQDNLDYHRREVFIS
ncbi:MAG: HNH endonuclease [Desulfobacterales bacterium]